MTTVEGLDPSLRTRWTRAFVDAGASQADRHYLDEARANAAKASGK